MSRIDTPGRRYKNRRRDPDAANDGRRIEALATLHDIAVPFGALPIGAVPLGVSRDRRARIGVVPGDLVRRHLVRGALRVSEPFRS
jgi:hypothetical protein